MIRREHPLQVQVKLFVKKCVDCEHEFASHDRAAPQSQMQHKWEFDRGVRKGWPDTELVLPEGRTFRCELKESRVKRLTDDNQIRLLARFKELGHVSTWANSVLMYGEICQYYGIPLKSNWRTVAEVADAYVAADIRTQEAKEAKKKAAAADDTTFKPKRKIQRKPSRSQIARVFGAMRPL
jgi:hypothetical protein